MVGNDSFIYSVGGYKCDGKYKKGGWVFQKVKHQKQALKIFKTFTFYKGKIMKCNMPSNYTTKVHSSLYNSCDYGRHAHHQTLAHDSTPIWF